MVWVSQSPQAWHNWNTYHKLQEQDQLLWYWVRVLISIDHALTIK